MLLQLLFLVPYVLSTCPPGTLYESVYNKCYKFFNDSVPFIVAEQRCQDFGAHLVVLQNAFENSYVSGIVAGNTAPAAYWIGANLLLSSKWTYTTGDNAVYINWAPQQPQDPSIYQCAAVKNVNNVWVKEQCSAQRPFVCAMSADDAPFTGIPSCPTSIPTRCSANTVCSHGYNLLLSNCKCYKFVKEERQHNEAEAYCHNDFAVLAKIEDQETNDFLLSLTAEYTCENGCPWIGLECFTPTNCSWTDGTSLYSLPGSGYSNFAPGQPSASPNPGVFMYLTADLAGKWSSWKYDSDAQFFCQKDPTTLQQLKEETIRKKQRQSL